MLLVFVKPAAWLITGSVPLLTSAVDALAEPLSSFATSSRVRYAERCTDPDHWFGLGKGEAIAGFVEAAFLVCFYPATAA